MPLFVNWIKHIAQALHTLALGCIITLKAISGSEHRPVRGLNKNHLKNLDFLFTPSRSLVMCAACSGMQTTHKFPQPRFKVGSIDVNSHLVPEHVVYRTFEITSI